MSYCETIDAVVIEPRYLLTLCDNSLQKHSPNKTLSG